MTTQHSHHDHSHDHGQAHVHGASDSTKRLVVVLVLTGGYMLLEAVAGWLTNSLALMADAGHMLTDTAAVALALFAARLAKLPANHDKSFGYYRAEILAALANAVTLIVIVVGIAWEAYRRVLDPPEVMGFEMMLVAVVGLAVNLAAAYVLHGGERESLNIQGVFWHVLGDALGSVAAIVAGMLMWWKGWLWADPVCSAAIGVIILLGAVRLTSRSLHVLMEGTPSGIDSGEIVAALSDVEGVCGVHDLHVWSVSTGRNALSAHLVVRNAGHFARVLVEARRVLVDRFNLEHSTLQIEPPTSSTWIARSGPTECRRPVDDAPCSLAPAITRCETLKFPVRLPHSSGALPCPTASRACEARYSADPSPEVC